MSRMDKWDQNDNLKLGAAIPYDIHAVSVSLPTWESVVGYEESDQEILSQLTSGYPRFKFHVFHDLINEKLISLHLPDEFSQNFSISVNCMIWPSVAVAKRFKSFMLNEPNSIAEFEIQLENFHDSEFCVSYFPKSAKSKAKAYWQHTGEIMSSRQALRVLNILNIKPLDIDLIELPETIECADISALDTIKNRILSITLPDFENFNHSRDFLDSTITITLSGMSAIFSTLRLFQEYANQNCSSNYRNGKIVVFGFPYLDTLKIMQRSEWNTMGFIFLGHTNDAAMNSLISILETNNSSDSPSDSRIMAVFTEFPTNPLLSCPNLAKLTELASKYNFLLAVDDTISSFGNVDLLTGNRGVKVDVLCSSLTKVFSGVGNVMAGSLLVNPYGSHAHGLQNVIKSKVLELPSICIDDAVVLERNSRDYFDRLVLSNSNALKLACMLLHDSRVVNVYYPGISDVETSVNATQLKPNANYYQYLRRSDSSEPSSAVDIIKEGCGFGCLLSFTLSAECNVQKLYNSLYVHKGPSLGTNYTLVCPYTLLAHYTELEWAASYGVSRDIIRVSVGLEDFDLIRQKFEFALNQSIS